MNARATMQRAATAAVTLALLAGTAACSSGSSSQPDAQPPATLQTSKAGGPARVTLTDDAIHRIDLRTAAVRHARVAVGGRPASSIVVPYSAVIYDSDGKSWAYAQVEPRVFVREPLTVAAVQGDTAVLSTGPADGTQVVTVGAPLLVGVETQIAGEE